MDLTALNLVDKLRKSSSICARVHFAGSKTNSLQVIIDVLYLMTITPTEHGRFIQMI